jgi:hypothetical protein
MKSSLLRLIIPSLLLLVPSFVRAEFNPAIVPADSQWVLHADLTALRDTVIGQKLLEQLPRVELTDEKNPVRPNIRKIMETVGTATAFGTDLSGKPEAIDGALVLQGTADLRKIAEGFVAQMSLSEPENAVEIKDLPFEAYVISKELFVAFPSEPIVLVSKSRTQLVKALEVFRGQAPSLKTGKSNIAAMLPKGGKFFLMGASIVPSDQQLFEGNGPEARILQMAKSGSVAVGEEGELAVARVQLMSASPEIATKLVKIVEGITAMLSLAETDDERLKDFVNALKVQRAGNEVTLGFSYPTARILKMVEDLQQAQAEHVHSEPGAPKSLSPEGEVISQWTADRQLDGDTPAASNRTTRKTDAVSLAPGSTVVLTGQRHEGEHARWDYVELTPVAGGSPQRFEAEYMRLAGYSIETSRGASGGEVIKTDGDGTARFRFNGAAGNYEVTIGYVDENDGRAQFAFSILAPDVGGN